MRRNKFAQTWAAQLENIKPKLDGDTIKMSLDPIVILKTGFARASVEVNGQARAGPEEVQDASDDR